MVISTAAELAGAAGAGRLALDPKMGVCCNLRVISRKAIVDFGRIHSDAWGPLDAWYRTVRRAKWRNLAEIRQVFRRDVDPGDRRTVFHIAGNKYRLVARVNYATQKVFVLAILTHAEYNKGGWKK